MSTLKPMSGIGKAANIEEIIATCELLGMNIVVVGHDTHRIKELYNDAGSKKRLIDLNHVVNTDTN